MFVYYRKYGDYTGAKRGPKPKKEKKVNALHCLLLLKAVLMYALLVI